MLSSEIMHVHNWRGKTVGLRMWEFWSMYSARKYNDINNIIIKIFTISLLPLITSDFSWNQNNQSLISTQSSHSPFNISQYQNILKPIKILPFIYLTEKKVAAKNIQCQVFIYLKNFSTYSNWFNLYRCESGTEINCRMIDLYIFQRN